VYKFGPGSPSSVLHDILAFAPDDVWAVGHVYEDTPDSTGHYRKPSNLLHWDGKEWTKYRILLDDCYPHSFGAGELWSIAGNKDNFIVCNSSGAGAQYNGLEFTPKCIKADYTVQWGAASEDICYVSPREWYFVGNNLGKGEVTLGQPPFYTRIAHIDELPINRIVSDGKGNLWAGGYSTATGDMSFMRITPDWVVHDLRKDIKIEGKWKFGGVSALWLSKDSLYAAWSAHLYIQALYDTSHYRFVSQLDVDPTRSLKLCMDGTADNDIFLGGGFNSVVHYNGKSMHYYPDILREAGAGNILGICVLDEYVYICGTGANTTAVIAVGKRKR
jgi:hypothetical protein